MVREYPIKPPHVRTPTMGPMFSCLKNQGNESPPRTGQFVHDHYLWVRRSHWRVWAAIFTLARGRHVEQFAIQLLGVEIRDEAAVVVALVDDQTFLAHFGRKVFVERNDAVDLCVGHVHIADTSAGCGVHFAGDLSSTQLK